MKKIYSNLFLIFAVLNGFGAFICCIVMVVALANILSYNKQFWISVSLFVLLLLNTVMFTKFHFIDKDIKELKEKTNILEE